MSMKTGVAQSVRYPLRSGPESEGDLTGFFSHLLPLRKIVKNVRFWESADSLMCLNYRKNRADRRD